MDSLLWFYTHVVRNETTRGRKKEGKRNQLVIVISFPWYIINRWANAVSLVHIHVFYKHIVQIERPDGASPPLSFLSMYRLAFLLFLPSSHRSSFLFFHLLRLLQFDVQKSFCFDVRSHDPGLLFPSFSSPCRRRCLVRREHWGDSFEWLLSFSYQTLIGTRCVLFPALWSFPHFSWHLIREKESAYQWYTSFRFHFMLITSLCERERLPFSLSSDFADKKAQEAWTTPALRNNTWNRRR